MRQKRDKDREKELFDASFGEVMASTDMFSCPRCGKRDCRCQRVARLAVPPPALQRSVAFAQRKTRKAAQKRLFRYFQKQTRASDEPMTVLSFPALVIRHTSHVIQVFITCNNCGKSHETNHCPVSYAMRHRQNLAQIKIELI